MPKQAMMIMGSNFNAAGALFIDRISATRSSDVQYVSGVCSSVVFSAFTTYIKNNYGYWMPVVGSNPEISVRFMSGLCYTVLKAQTSEKGMVSYVMYASEKYEERANSYDFNIFGHSKEEIYDALYDRIKNHTSLPILREWMPEILDNIVSEYQAEACRILSIYNSDPFMNYKGSIVIDSVRNDIRDLIKSGKICIKPGYTTSPVMRTVNGLDNYLGTFAPTFARDIQSAFTPKFIPGESKYDERTNDFDDACYCHGIELYEAQKEVIQASVNNLREENVSMIIGECGCGKTLMGAGIPYVHYGKNGYNVIVMAPGHLVKKWKREVERLVPNSKAYIISSISDIAALDSILKDRNKTENTYLILSKEMAKLGYEEYPAVVYSCSRKAYICPKCGRTLNKSVFTGHGHRRFHNDEKMNDLDFLKKDQNNTVCSECGNKLWSAANKKNNSKWIKISDVGWLDKERIKTAKDKLFARIQATKDSDSQSERPSKQDLLLYQRLSAVYEDYEKTGKYKECHTIRRYPISRYLKKYYSNFIDYAILDELHLYAGESAQGQAACELIKTANKTICLTGTLLNGYADSIFYILYRAFPKLMRKSGYTYTDSSKFMEDFGVIQNITKYRMIDEQIDWHSKKKSTRRMPGISPLVFTKFLLNNAVFISLSDMSEGLPSYTEIPVGIDMDDTQKSGYQDLEDKFIENSKRGMGFGGGISDSVTALDIYPDMPYDQEPIFNNKTNEELFTPINCEKKLYPKEERVLEIVQNKIENGEKVLIYYSWVNKSDAADKLLNLLKSAGIKAVVMRQDVANDKREEWIDEQIEKNGIDVMIANPSLVETGLDLLPFTTIIFYQLGYNVYTMRQSSRRSWRLSQTHPIEVYFMYYNDTIQQDILSLMADKLKASMAIEGKFSEEGLRAMSNDTDIVTQVANSVVNGIKHTVNTSSFSTINGTSGERAKRPHYKTWNQIARVPIKPYMLSYFKTAKANSMNISAMCKDKRSLLHVLLRKI